MSERPASQQLPPTPLSARDAGGPVLRTSASTATCGPVKFLPPIDPHKQGTSQASYTRVLYSYPYFHLAHKLFTNILFKKPNPFKLHSEKFETFFLLQRAERLSKTLDPQQYMEWSECRQVSFSKFLSSIDVTLCIANLPTLKVLKTEDFNFSSQKTGDHKKNLRHKSTKKVGILQLNHHCTMEQLASTKLGHPCRETSK